MSYLIPQRRAQIQERITSKEAQLAAANAAYTAALTNSEVQTYSFDSGEGRQSTTRRKPEELARIISQLERDIDSLYSRLNGTGLCVMNLRRR